MNTITVEDFVRTRAVRNARFRIKVLGNGKIERAVKVHAHKFSRSAVEKITAAGGEAIAIEG